MQSVTTKTLAYMISPSKKNSTSKLFYMIVQCFFCFTSGRHWEKFNALIFFDPNVNNFEKRKKNNQSNSFFITKKGFLMIFLRGDFMKDFLVNNLC